MAHFAIVGFYLSLNVFLLIFLSMKVIGVRRRDRISIGDGDNKRLAYLSRAQGNAVEYMPMFFLLLAVAAFLQSLPVLLHFFGLVFTIGRLCHALWFLKPSRHLKLRVGGMMLTFLSMGSLAIFLLAQATFILAKGY